MERIEPARFPPRDRVDVHADRRGERLLRHAAFFSQMPDA
jgi:hypothetical protein